LMSDDRRYPVKPFDPALIRDFLHGRKISTVELMASGRSNTNYKLVLTHGNTYALRIYSHGDARRETYVMDLVRDLVPVPVEVPRGGSWSVFSFLEGALLQDVPEHSGAAVQALTRISSVVLASPGIIEPDARISQFAFGGAKGYILESLENPGVSVWLGPEWVEAVLRILKREEGRLAELDAECRLVHGDFNPTNILIKDDAVSGVLDWEFCHSGSPYMDIGNLLRHTGAEYHPLIESGLRAGGMALPGDWRERAELVDLTSQIEFLNSTRSTVFKQQCVARIRGFIAKNDGTA